MSSHAAVICAGGRAVFWILDFGFVRKKTKNVEQQLLLELFPSKLVFPPHSPPLNLTYFPDYVRNPDEVLW